jgi:chromosomal replication initiation ATPase DnaA
MKNPYYTPGVIEVRITPEQFIQESCKLLEITYADLVKKGQDHRSTFARAAIVRRMLIVFRYERESKELTLEMIGKYIGRNHVAVLHYRDRLKPHPMLDKNLELLKHIGLYDLVKSDN